MKGIFSFIALDTFICAFVRGDLNDNDILDIVSKVTLADLRFPVWSIVDIPTRFVASLSCWIK